MAGHSHWKNIKRKKGALDAKRGKIWSKLSRQIIVTAQRGGGNPDFNFALRLAIEKARAANMPNDTIDKAIKKGTGEDSATQFEETVYEGFGPGGVAVLCEILTDNKNRTAPEVRKIFEKNGGNMGGAVAWLFSKRGVVTVNASQTTEDQLIELTLDAGPEDIRVDGDVFQITCEPAALETVKAALSAGGVQVASAELELVASQSMTVSGQTAQSVVALLEALEDHDDIQAVHSNADIAEEAVT